MINWQASAGVFVNQRKSRTGRRRSRAYTGSETFDELRFAAAKIAGERKHIARFEVFREPTAKGYRFVRAIGNARSHRAEVEKLRC